MFCILAFVLLVLLFPVLGISPSYRRWFRRAWGCVFKKMTLQPCDVNIWDELKNKLLGRFIFRFPRMTKFFDRTLAVWAIAFVLLNVWTVWTATNAGLNLWVYGTCNATSGESCSLSGEACGVAQYQLRFSDAVREGVSGVGAWVWQPFGRFFETVSRIPNRIKTWNAEEYVGPTATYYHPYDSTKPVAVEILDPGCHYCRQLFRNMQDAGFLERYNVTYLVYPIPDTNSPTGYKFGASDIIARYLEAVKMVPLTSNSSSVPADWQLLERIFGPGTIAGSDMQNQFNMLYRRADIPTHLEELLVDIGYSPAQIETIRLYATTSESVEHAIREQRRMVEDRVKTIRIPTLLFGGRRYDRVVQVDELQ